MGVRHHLFAIRQILTVRPGLSMDFPLKCPSTPQGER